MHFNIIIIERVSWLLYILTNFEEILIEENKKKRTLEYVSCIYVFVLFLIGVIVTGGSFVFFVPVNWD